MTSKKWANRYDVVMASQFTYSSLIKPSRTSSLAHKVGLRKNKFRDYWLNKPIHLYRMWFLLCVWLLTVKTTRFGWCKERTLSQTQQTVPKDWDIHNYLDARFDDWFKDKIHLFGEQEVSIVKEGNSHRNICIWSSIRIRGRKTYSDKRGCCWRTVSSNRPQSSPYRDSTNTSIFTSNTTHLSCDRTGQRTQRWESG